MRLATLCPRRRVQACGGACVSARCGREGERGRHIVNSLAGAGVATGAGGGGGGGGFSVRLDKASLFRSDAQLWTSSAAHTHHLIVLM